ncbi:MAG: M23 family metallopeptidase [Candidatus Acidiferrales bacterium]
MPKYFCRSPARSTASIGLGALIAFVIFAWFPSASAAQTVTLQPDIQGTWKGTLGAGGAGLHLLVTLTKLASGEYSGQLDSVDQGAILSIESASLEGNSVRFSVSRVGGLFVGELSMDGSVITGTWTQTGVPRQPLTFQRSAPGSSSSSLPISAPHTPKPVTAPLDIVIPTAPTAFKADGKWNLVYEMHVMNLGRYDCALTKIDVVSGDPAHASLASFEGAALDAMFFQIKPPENKSSIVPGGFAIVYMWVTVDRQQDVPASIAQRVTMKIGDYPDPMTITTVSTPVNRNPVLVIGAPLEGGDWVAGNGPSNTSAHRRALIPIDGRAYLSQRYAIDWVRLNPDGKDYTGDPSDNRNYRAYGAEIHSVADGVVTTAVDGIPQNIPGENSRAVPMTFETISGNHVIVDIGGGLFAFYAHMQPGTVRVKVGDRVHRGQVLGLLGNTGNSTEPHLHFHICNANSDLECEGVPYAFTSFELQGRGENWKPADSHATPVKDEMEIPTEDDIVRFLPGP